MYSVLYIILFLRVFVAKRAYLVHGDTSQMAIRLRAKMFFDDDDKILILALLGF